MTSPASSVGNFSCTRCRCSGWSITSRSQRRCSSNKRRLVVPTRRTLTYSQLRTKNEFLQKRTVRRSTGLPSLLNRPGLDDLRFPPLGDAAHFGRRLDLLLRRFCCLHDLG